MEEILLRDVSKFGIFTDSTMCPYSKKTYGNSSKTRVALVRDIAIKVIKLKPLEVLSFNHDVLVRPMTSYKTCAL